MPRGKAPEDEGQNYPHVRAGEVWIHRIQDKANRKRSEAAKAQPRTETGVFQPVEEHSVPPPAKPKEKPERKAKAAASKTNPGAVARGDKLAKERPDLAEDVRLGKKKPAEAHRQMKKDEVKEKTKALPEGKHRVIYADPPWACRHAAPPAPSPDCLPAQRHALLPGPQPAAARCPRPALVLRSYHQPRAGNPVPGTGTQAPLILYAR